MVDRPEVHPSRTLTAQDNWASLVFGGGAVGGAGSSQGLRTDEGLRELTKYDWARMHGNN
ncbi:hypothetical protein [Kitasatospora herbaricolor]|uniref:hypothetical protein n=1 Tax=Kitasatospora herbaricolor TaxID=68217 RepID=UPI0036DB0B21